MKNSPHFVGLACVCLAGAAAATGWWRTRAEHSSDPTELRPTPTIREPAVRVDARKPAPRGSVDEPATLAREVEDPALTRLKVALESGDARTRVEGIRQVAAEGVYEALPLLLERGLDRDPDSAVTLIRAIGILTRLAPETDRAGATRRLQTWLAHESVRAERGADANTVALLKALASIGGADARLTLRNTLDAARLPLPMQTLIVQQLGEQRDPRDAPALERFLARVETQTAETAMDRELQAEAKAAARDALAGLLARH
ncbi:MAG TPA: hypothetical protein VFQ61_10800 [Polyangiaceae bacterium]|nr:hypothetical protein [Polyangiaceae bacterium]